MANFRQGARRVKIVGQLAVGVSVLIMIWFFALPSYRNFVALLFTTLYSLIAPIVLGLFMGGVGWILEGFAKPDEQAATTNTAKVSKRP